MRNRALNANTKVRALALGGAVVFVGCEKKADALTPERIDQQYGVSGAYTDDAQTSDGAIRGTLVPVTVKRGIWNLVLPRTRTGQHSAIQASTASV